MSARSADARKPLVRDPYRRRKQPAIGADLRDARVIRSAVAGQTRR